MQSRLGAIVIIFLEFSGNCIGERRAGVRENQWVNKAEKVSRWEGDSLVREISVENWGAD